MEAGYPCSGWYRKVVEAGYSPQLHVGGGGVLLGSSAEANPRTAPGWAHVVCALYIPEVQFANVLTMEPIVLQYVPHDRFNKVSGPVLVPFLACRPGLPPYAL